MDRYNQQNSELLAANADLERELGHTISLKARVVELEERSTQLQRQFSVKSSEADSLTQDKRSMTKQIEDLQNEIDVRKFEVSAHMAAKNNMYCRWT